MTMTITIGKNKWGWWVSRDDPRYSNSIIRHTCLFSVPLVYLYPDGLWRTAAILHTGERSYMPDPETVALVLRPAAVELAGQYPGHKIHIVTEGVSTDEEADMWTALETPPA